MEVRSFKTEEEARKQAGAALNALFEKYKNSPFLFLSSGGSALSLVEGIATEYLGVWVTIGVVDERFSKEPTANNFAQLTKTAFYHTAHEKGASFIDTRVQGGETLEDAAERFEKALRDWRNTHPEGTIIATLGIGADGHTAGIAPAAAGEVLHNKLYYTSHWVVGYDAQDALKYPLRVTITIPFLRGAVDHAVVYAAGQDKQKALRRTLAKEGAVEETPARVFHEMKSVTLFTPTPLQKAADVKPWMTRPARSGGNGGSVGLAEQ